MKLVFYDFEVFHSDWMVVFIDYETKNMEYIINDSKKLREYYEDNRNSIFCGYNCRQYDQFIFKSILLGLDPYDISNKIIVQNKKGYQVLRKAKEYPLNNFDVSTGFHSLKQLEGFMGSKIKESSVPFDIQRKLTDVEIDEVLEYCIHDVEETMKVFNNLKEEFDSQFSLIEAFNLPLEMFSKTKAQLSAHVLQANRGQSFKDEFNLSFPNTLKLDKYQYIYDWYKDTENRDYNKVLYTDVAGVPHVYGWGGIHGAVDNYVGDGIILCGDVASLYPSLMIQYDYLSRNITEPEKYKEIYDTRLKLKAEKNPMQLPYKIVLNASYGAMKDCYNGLYDPLMANNVCVAGQLLLLDLTEKIESYCELIQSNTDGLFLKVADMETVDMIKAIAAEWEQRTRLNLEWEIYNKIYQKDVNNYIIVDSNGNYKSKGAYVKKLSQIDYDLPIINKALVNYFIKNESIEDTINGCNDLIEFQKIVKVSNLYKYALHGDKKLPEKVLRVFASKYKDADGVFKVKVDGKKEKIANTPVNCFINNEDVCDIEVPADLDKQYYVNLANKRLSDYLSPKSNKKIKIQSGIKGVNSEIKEKLIDLSKREFSSFVDFLVCVTEEVSAKKATEILIKLNYFKKFGNNLKLLKIFNEFTNGENKYTKSLNDATKWDRVSALCKYENSLEDEMIPVSEQLNYEIKMLGCPKSKYKVPKGTAIVLELNTDFSPRAIVYGLSTGKQMEVKIQKRLFKNQPFKENDIVRFTRLQPKPKLKCVGDDKMGKLIFEEINGEMDIWAEEYYTNSNTVNYK